LVTIGTAEFEVTSQGSLLQGRLARRRSPDTFLLRMMETGGWAFICGAKPGVVSLGDTIVILLSAA
jgi:hypothetical protein